MCDPDKLTQEPKTTQEAMPRDPQERIAELLKANIEFERRAREAEGKLANLRAALKDSITENVWSCYSCGIIQNGQWWQGGMSDAEWLARQLGLTNDRYPVEEVTGKFDVLVECLVARAEAGEIVE
jgi:hypothetical protein